MENNEKKPNESSCCLDCVFLNEEENACIAFPYGIPDKYLSGEQKHDTPDKDQFVSAVYEQKPIEY